MQWRIHDERQVYGSPWVDVWLADVERPDGHRVDYHTLRLRHVAAAAVVDERERVLLMWRHRFVTDTWAWELPMGLIEPDETPMQAAAREVEEETGWRPGPLKPLVYAQPGAGIMNSEHHVFLADSAVYVGEPVERNESDHIEWVSLSDLRSLIDSKQIVSSATLVGLYALLLGRAG